MRRLLGGFVAATNAQLRPQKRQLQQDLITFKQACVFVRVRACTRVPCVRLHEYLRTFKWVSQPLQQRHNRSVCLLQHAIIDIARYRQTPADVANELVRHTATTSSIFFFKFELHKLVCTCMHMTMISACHNYALAISMLHAL